MVGCLAAVKTATKRATIDHDVMQVVMVAQVVMVMQIVMVGPSPVDTLILLKQPLATVATMDQVLCRGWSCARACVSCV